MAIMELDILKLRYFFVTPIIAMNRKKPKMPKRGKMDKEPAQRAEVIHDIYNVNITDIMRMAGSKMRADAALAEQQTEHGFKMARQKQKTTEAFIQGRQKGISDVFNDQYGIAASFRNPDSVEPLVRIYPNTASGEAIRAMEIYDYKHGEGAYDALPDADKSNLQSQITNLVGGGVQRQRSDYKNNYKKLVLREVRQPGSITEDLFGETIKGYDYELPRFVGIKDFEGVEVSRPLELEQMLTKYHAQANGMIADYEDAVALRDYKSNKLDFDRFKRDVLSMKGRIPGIGVKTPAAKGKVHNPVQTFVGTHKSQKSLAKLTGATPPPAAPTKMPTPKQMDELLGLKITPVRSRTVFPAPSDKNKNSKFTPIKIERGGVGVYKSPATIKKSSSGGLVPLAL